LGCDRMEDSQITMTARAALRIYRISGVSHSQLIRRQGRKLEKEECLQVEK
jgi:hypothetical protein